MKRTHWPRRSLIHRLLSLPLRFKIAIPYLIVASLLAGLAAFLVGRAFVETLEERFRSQLEDASARAAQDVLDLEAFHLQMLRTMAFTEGVAQAVQEGETASLETLLFPHIVNNQIYHVDVLTAEGNPLASWHRQGDALEYRRDEFMDYRRLGVVRLVLDRQVDAQGDKYAAVVETPWGLCVYTVGPVLTSDGLAGVLLVGTPLREALEQLALNTLSNITLYAPDGTVALSTLGDNSAVLPAEVLQQLPNVGEQLLTRRIQVEQRGYVEAVESLFLRGEPSGWVLGVALPESLVREAQGPTVTQVLVIAIVGVLALIGLGVVVAQLIAVPVFRLLDASERVGRGHLDVEVPVDAEDEIGLLTRAFNRMVVGLKQREFIREMFGRMVSADVREAVLQNKVRLGGEVHEVAVLFTDVRGFTTLSEQHSPAEIVAMLNEFFNIVTTATRQHHGVVNHFGGDSVLAVFGAPISRPQAVSLEQAVRTAMEIQQQAIELNARRISEGKISFQFGIGINAGPVVAGNIGSEDRFTYTVIGDVVNVAARLQGLSRQFPRTPVLMPQSSLRLLATGFPVVTRPLGEYALKGKSQRVPVVAVLGIHPNAGDDENLFASCDVHLFEGLAICHLLARGYPTAAVAQALQVDIETLRCVETVAQQHQERVQGMLHVLYRDHAEEAEQQ